MGGVQLLGMPLKSSDLTYTVVRIEKNGIKFKEKLSFDRGEKFDGSHNGSKRPGIIMSGHVVDRFRCDIGHFGDVSVVANVESIYLRRGGDGREFYKTAKY
ncbi:hypothetical protein Tco_1228461 [Tanacetum coccineum]